MFTLHASHGREAGYCCSRVCQFVCTSVCLCKNLKTTNQILMLLGRNICMLHANNFEYTLCLKKVPFFKLSVTLSNLYQVPKFLHCWKASEICYETVQHYPPYPRYVDTLPREIENSNLLHIFSRYGRKCKQIAF